MICYKKTGDSTPHPNETKIFSEKEQELRDYPILTYLNWSYAIEFHIGLDKLEDMLFEFDYDYTPFYVRLYNEVPYSVIENFVNKNPVCKSQIEDIYTKLIVDNKMTIGQEFWINTLKSDEKIPLEIKTMQNPYLWGTTFTNEMAYDNIINDGEHFEFCFIRLFENENKVVVYQNLGVDKIIELEKHLHLLKKYTQEGWTSYLQTFKKNYDDIKKMESK